MMVIKLDVDIDGLQQWMATGFGAHLHHLTLTSFEAHRRGSYQFHLPGLCRPHAEIYAEKTVDSAVKAARDTA